MIQINLQYLAYICYSIAIYQIIQGLYVFFSLYGGPDLSNVLAIHILSKRIMAAFGIAILGFLIFKAFKE